MAVTARFFVLVVATVAVPASVLPLLEIGSGLLITLCFYSQFFHIQFSAWEPEVET